MLPVSTELALRSYIRENIRDLDSNDLALLEAPEFKKQLITEAFGEAAIKNLIQGVVAGAAQYGISFGTAGGGVPVGSGVETVIDALFASYGIADALNAIASIPGQLGDLYAAFQEALTAYSTASSFDDLYEKVKGAFEKGMAALGPVAEKAGETLEVLVDEFQEKLGSIIKKMSKTLGDGIQLMVPDATIGGTIATAVEEILNAASDNAYTLITGALSQFGTLEEWILDPQKAIDFFKDVLEKVISILKKMTGSDDSEEKSASFLTSLIPGFSIVSSGLSTLANMVISQIEEQGPKILEMLASVLTKIMPVTLTALALYQVIASGDYEISEVIATDTAEVATEGVAPLSRDKLVSLIAKSLLSESILEGTHYIVMSKY